MLSPYRRVFRHPGALAFSLTGLVARLPISMMTLGIVLLVSATTGSYGLAGQIAAAYIAGNALFAIPHGRLADRFGQGRVLYVDTAVFLVSTATLIVSVSQEWHLLWAHLAAALSGASIPQIGTMVRGRWAHLLTSPTERHTAFAVEGVADEVVYVTGPTIVTLLATVYAPAAGLAVALAFGTLGALALARQRATEPPAHPREGGGPRDPMPWGLLTPLAVGALTLGSLFGALEVATVAFADDEGHKAWAGVMLGVFSLGSLIAGVAAGVITWQRGPMVRARIGLWLLALGTVALPWLGGLVAVTAALFVTGLALAPTLIALFSIIEAGSPRSRLNEAMGFVQMGIGAGIAPGAWLAGVVADESGGSAAFWVVTISALLAALAGMVVQAPAAEPAAAAHA